MASQQIIVFDAWIHEVEEAMRLAEDIESRIRERGSFQAVGGDPNSVLIGARRKLMLLATKLDRLESLLQNPPAKPVLSERDLHSRKDMILDMQQRTKQMAISLSTSQSLQKTDVRDVNANLLVVDKEKPTNPNNHGISYLEGQVVKDKELLSSKVTENKSKHIATAAEEKINLDIPLLDDVDKADDSTQSVMCPMMRNGLVVVGGWFDGCHSIISLLLIAFTIVILILIILAVIESL